MSIRISDKDYSDVKVMVRVRPFLPKEVAVSAKKNQALTTCVSASGGVLSLWESQTDETDFIFLPPRQPKEAFLYHGVLWSVPADQHLTTTPYADQSLVYDVAGKPALHDVLDGNNACIMTYGQTGTGKTYTVFGNREEPGIAPRMLSDLFLAVEKSKAADPHRRIEVHLTFYEIYGEKVRDLCTKRAEDAKDICPMIRQHPTRGVYIDNVGRYLVESDEMAMRLTTRGHERRRKATGSAWDASSRSHAILKLEIRQIHPLLDELTESSVHLLDAAGSEKIKITGCPIPLSEAKNINMSLSTLRKVFDTLIDNQSIKNRKNHRVPPFRESVLTWCLSDCLGGNCKTQMIATISPHEMNMEDTLGTLRYALRLKALTCRVRKNTERLTTSIECLKEEMAFLQERLSDPKYTESSMKAELKGAIATRLTECQQLEAHTSNTSPSPPAPALVTEQSATDVQETEVDSSAPHRQLFREAFIQRAELPALSDDQFGQELSELCAAREALQRETDRLQAELLLQSKWQEEYCREVDVSMMRVEDDIAERDATIESLQRELAALHQSSLPRSKIDTTPKILSTPKASKPPLKSAKR